MTLLLVQARSLEYLLRRCFLVVGLGLLNADSGYCFSGGVIEEQLCCVILVSRIT